LSVISYQLSVISYQLSVISYQKLVIKIKNRKMEKSSYQGLLVWQKAMDLTAVIYNLTKKLPKEELYSLSVQMRRASVSIPSNIAEGHDRNSNKEFIHFLTISRGSKAELETQLLICVKVCYLNESEILEAMNLSKEIGKMLTSLIKKLVISCQLSVVSGEIEEKTEKLKTEN
jgi:four helix bundle protein